MARLCVIGVRSGSKSIPHKNIAKFADKPLLAHSILHATECGLFDHICVSSDSQEYLDLAKEYGSTVTVMRPPELASDTAAKIPVIRHAIEEVEKQFGTTYNVIVDLQVTSPLRLSHDIKNAVELFENTNDVQNVVSVKKAHSSPYFTLLERAPNNQIKLCKQLETSVVRRQDAPATYDINGSVYVWDREVIMSVDKVINDRTEIYEMPDYRSIDIDNPLDFALAEFVYNSVDLNTGELKK